MFHINPLSLLASKRRGREKQVKNLKRIGELLQGDFFEARSNILLDEARLPFQKPVLSVEKGTPMILLSPIRSADDKRAFVCELSRNICGWIDLWSVQENGTMVPKVRNIKRGEKVVAEYQKHVALPIGRHLGNTMRKGMRCTSIMPIELRQSYEDGSTVLLSAPMGEHLEILHAMADSVFAVSLLRRKTIGWMTYRSKSGMPCIRAMSKVDEEQCLSLAGLQRRLFQGALCVVTRGPLEMLYYQKGVVASEKLHTNSLFTFVRFLSGDVIKMVDTFGLVAWMKITDKTGNLAIKIDYDATSFTMLTAEEELLIAAKGGNLPTLMVACDSIDVADSVQAVDTEGRSPLFYAVAHGHVQCANYMLDLPGVRGFTVDNCSRQPLHYAYSSPPSKDMVVLLLSRRARVDHRDKDRRTALMMFATGHDVQSVEALLQAGADINSRCKAGWTACDYALAARNLEMYSYLRGLGGRSNSSKAVPRSIEIEPWNAQMEPALQVNLSEEIVELEECLQFALDNPNPKLLEYVFYIAQSCKVDMHKIVPIYHPKQAKRDIDDLEVGARATPQVSVSAPSRSSLATHLEERPTLAAQLRQAMDAQNADAVRREEAKAKDAVLGELNSLSMLSPLPLTSFYDALSQVEQLGLEHESIPRYRRVFQNERAELEASLANATQMEDSAAIKELLPTCKYVGVDVSAASSAMERILEKNASRDRIDAMIASGDDFSMNAYKEELAVFARLMTTPDEPTFARYRAHLEQEELRAQHKLALHHLSQARTKEELEQAIREAQESEVLDASTLQPFLDVLAHLEPADICAESLSAELKLRVDEMRLDRVAHWKNSLALYREHPELVSDAEAILAEEGPRFFAKQKLQECGRADPSTADPFVDALQIAIDQAKKEEVPPDVLAPYEEQLQEAINTLPLRRARLAGSAYPQVTDIGWLEAGRNILSEAIASAQEQGISEEELNLFILHRRRIHNRLEELKGKIRIYTRVRPVGDEDGPPICVPNGEMGVTVLPLSETQDEKQLDFIFDACFAPGEQAAIFADVADLLQSVCDGYRCAIFTYGQTGSGKTHTLFGSVTDPGITRRTGAHLFSIMQKMRVTYSFEVYGSIYEVYRKRITDLLVDTTIKAKEIVVGYDERANKVTIEGLTERVLNDASDVDRIVEDGLKIRKVSATEMNVSSSRSHLMLQLRVVNHRLATNERSEGKIVLIDLAGSERIKKSGASKKTQEEAVDINVGLTALGDVIQAAADNQRNIPYRNHVLTKIMRDAIGGTAKTLMIVNVSPLAENRDETLQSIRWASRAKAITADESVVSRIRRN